VLHVILAASEPSKVPFYVVGGAFVVWALLLAMAGLRNTSFPGGVGGQRGVMAVSLVLAAGVMGTAVYIK
jgi:hypothetical protein